VGVNTENPDEAMTIHGNLKVTGHILSPSDVRAKQDFEEVFYHKTVVSFIKNKKIAW